MGSVDGSCPRAKGKRESAITAILSGVSHTGGDPLKKTSSPSLFRSNSSSLNDRGGDTQASPATITGNSGTSGSASDDGSSNARHNAGEHFIDSLDRIRTSEGKRARTSAAASSLRRIVKTPSLHIRLQVACGKLFSRWSPVDPPNACVILMIMDRSLPLPSWQYVDETESVENDTFPHFEHLFDLHLKPMDEIKFVVYDVDMAPPVGDDEVGYCCAWTNQLIHHSVTGTPTATITDISVAAGSVPVSVSSSSPVLSRSLSSLLNPPPPMKLRLTSDDPARRKELSDVGAFLTLSIRH